MNAGLNAPAFLLLHDKFSSQIPLPIHIQPFVAVLAKFILEIECLTAFIKKSNTPSGLKLVDSLIMVYLRISQKIIA